MVAMRLLDGCHEVAVCLPQVRIGKDRIDKDRLIEESYDSSCTEPEVVSVLEFPC